MPSTPSKRLTGSLAAALTLALVLPADAAVVHRERSAFGTLYVHEEAGERCLSFSPRSNERQTCIDLDEPQRLVFEYYKGMMGALYLNPAPRRVLVIGLGGGALPAALQRLDPALEMDVVEIDPVVVRIARRFFGFDPAAGTRVHEEDGRAFVQRARKEGLKYDLVMLDAFDADYVPAHLMTIEFLLELKDLLAPGGVVAANTFSYSRLQRQETATYFGAFGAFYNLKGGNRIILAARDGLPPLETVNANAKALDERLRPLGVEPRELLQRFTLQQEMPRNTRVLTDRNPPSARDNRK